MIDSLYYITNLLFFSIPLLYYYINFRSTITYCLFPGDIYLLFSISLSSPKFSVSILTALEILQILATLLRNFISSFVANHAISFF